MLHLILLDLLYIAQTWYKQIDGWTQLSMCFNNVVVFISYTAKPISLHAT